MALSGVFSTTIATGYRLQLEWSATQSTINNTSTITTNLYWMSLGSSYTVNSSATKTGSTTIAEETFNFSGAGLASLSGNQKKLIHTAVKTISHNANGYLDTTLSAVFNIAVTLGTYYASVSIPSSPITLDRILRLSYPTLSPNPITMGGDMVITSNRVSGDYLHKYYYSFGGITKTLISGSTNVNNFTWTTDLATLAGQVTGATSGTGTIYCETYSGATLLGESQTSFTAVVPASVVPTQTSITLTELTSGVQTLLGNTDYFIQGISNIRATINGGAGVYGSTIDKYYHRLFGVEYENATNVYDSGVISGSGNQIISGRVKDTRGRYSVYSDTSTKTIIPYSVPVVNTFTVLRCTSNGTLDDLGEYVKIVRSGTATTLPVATVEKNRISTKVYYKIKGAGSWTEITTSTPSGIKVTESSDLENGVTTTSYVVGTGTTFAVTNVYEFKLEIIDKLNTTTSNTVTVPIGSTVMSWSDVGVGIGKVWQSGALDVKGVSNFEGVTNLNGVTNALGLISAVAGMNLSAPIDPMKIRYIRDYISGSSANGDKQWNEVQALTSGGTNRALNKTVTGSATTSNLTYVTNGDLTVSQYANCIVGGLQYVQIDLGAVYTDIVTIKSWHYWLDVRWYGGHKIEVSEDGITWIKIYDVANTGERIETSNGISIKVPNTKPILISGGGTQKLEYIGYADGSSDILINNVPLVQSGNNGLGDWTRFYDGTQICVMSATTINSGAGTTLGVPNVFKDTAYVCHLHARGVASGGTTGSYVGECYPSTRGTIVGKCLLHSATTVTNPGNTGVMITATGRWY